MSGNSSMNSKNYKSRRRSKKDNEGRNFKCDKCDKTYLSYPALYTHTKLKHSDGNDGKPVLPVFSGRGRGRPRKNVSTPSTKTFVPTSAFVLQNQKRVDPTTEEYFKNDGREGGPSNPIHGFEEVIREFQYDKYSDYKQFPLYKYLERFAQLGGFIDKLSEGVHNKEVAKVEEDEPTPSKGNSGRGNKSGAAVKEEQSKKDNDPSNLHSDQEPLFVDPNSKKYLKRDSSDLPEEERNKISCDEVFAIYLYEISKKVNPEYYKSMLRFIIAYRECLNRFGWEKKAENDEVLNNSGNGEDLETTMITPASEGVLEKAKELRNKAKGLEFSVINNAEHAPEICNEFVTVFLQEKSKDINLQKNESIDLTRNICHWLFTESYTCSKVSMIKS